MLDENGSYGKFVKPIELFCQVTATDGPIVSNFNIIIYQGVSFKYIVDEEMNTEGDVAVSYTKPNFIDDVFDLITANPIMKNENIAVYSSVTYEKN